MAGLLSVKGETYVITGVVRDSISHEPIPYAAIELVGTQAGALADEMGHFSVTTTRPFRGIMATSMGYDSKTIGRPQGTTANVTIDLVASSVRLSELTVKPGREHYSKRNNPAVAFMESIRRGSDMTDPRRHPYYSFDRYERITLALDNFNGGDSVTGNEGNALARRFPVLREHTDTSAFTGRPILNIALREKATHVNYRQNPMSEKELVTGFRGEGIDQMLDPQATQTFYEDVLREVDIYGNDITLMQNRFVSPLSRIAPDFYKFYLTDTVKVGIDSCIVLSFAPHNAATFGFVGKLYVLKNDTTFFVRRIEMSAPKDINLNFINNLKIVQEYRKAGDGTRLKKLDDMIVEGGLFGSDLIYARRIAAYSGHSFNAPIDASVFEFRGPTKTLPGAETRDEAFWQSRRFADISRAENSVGTMLDALRRDKFFYWTEKVLKVLVTGYIPTGNPSKWDFGPVNTALSFNDLEGCRLKIGGMSTGNLSRRFFTKDYIAFGTKDHRWKYLTELEYSFHAKSYHAREFPVHSLRFTHLYDVDMLGQHFFFTNPDNIFLSIRREKDRMMNYHRVTKLEYNLELENNFSVNATVKHERREDSRFITFEDGYGCQPGHYSMATVSVTLRYAPGEKFFQTKASRFPVNMDAPIFQITHTYGPRNVFGNRYELNVTEASFQKRFWFSAFGYLDLIVSSGHVWSRSPWPNLLIPNANLSYTIQPESFALLNPLEFINDSYVQWDLTYWANGALLNYIPFVKKTRLREVFAFRGVWGHLSDHNNPSLHPELFRFPEGASPRLMTSMPYMEISAGLDNIFRILRLDYVWRLSYRDVNPKGGLRLALHFTF